MSREEIETILQSILDRESDPFDPPGDSDWRSLEARFGTGFPPEFKNFIELMSEYSFPGDIYNVPRGAGVITNGNDTMVTVYEAESASRDWPAHLLPFYGIGNGDYFALDIRERDLSAVYFRDHGDGAVTRYADSFGEWVRRLPMFLQGGE